MGESRRGPRTKYTDEQLIAEVMRYASRHPGEKIEMKELILESGISKATWYRSPVAKNKIDQMNFAPMMVQTTGADIATLADIAKSCGEDPEKYKEMTGKLLDIIAAQQDELAQIKENSIKQESQEMQNLKKQLNESQVLVERLNTRLNAAINAQDKLINIGDNTDKMDKTTFNAQFGDLFDE